MILLTSTISGVTATTLEFYYSTIITAVTSNISHFIK